MGIRSKLKSRLKGMVGGNTEDASRAGFLPQTAADPRHYTPEPRADPPPKAAPVPAPAPAAPALSEEEQKKQAKAAAHFEKTRKAVLKFVIDAGGTAPMAQMHDHSERRYFIGHKKFSDLMEGIIAEGLVDFDHAKMVATITDAGRAYVA